MIGRHLGHQLGWNQGKFLYRIHLICSARKVRATLKMGASNATGKAPPLCFIRICFLFARLTLRSANARISFLYRDRAVRSDGVNSKFSWQIFRHISEKHFTTSVLACSRIAFRFFLLLRDMVFSVFRLRFNRGCIFNNWKCQAIY